MKKLSNIFIALAIILSNIMCAVVGYNYASMQWGIKYAGYSAPASIVFVYAIPYVVAIIVCVILSIRFRNK
jgi:TRAP-type C4-dicarboxylate transport system permease small subunit